MEGVGAAEQRTLMVHLPSSCHLVRYSSLTDAECVVQLLVSRLDAEPRPCSRLYALRRLLFPRDGPTDMVWLPRSCLLCDAVDALTGVDGEWRFDLRVRQVPAEPRALLQRDRVTFQFYYDQVRDDYLSLEAGTAPLDTAVQLACFDIRRYFRDLPHNALDKKSNMEYLEQSVGMDKFVPSSVVHACKPKTLRKLIQQQFRKCGHMAEAECMLRYLQLLRTVTRYDEERFQCLLGSWETPVELVVAPDAGLTYHTSSGGSTLLGSFQQLQTVSTDDSARLRLRLAGCDDLIQLTCVDAAVCRSLADLLDGYSRLVNESAVGVWTRRSPSPLQPPAAVSRDSPRRRSQRSTVSGDYAEIVDADAAETLYSTVCRRDCELARELLQLLGIIGEGQFGDVYRGLYTPAVGASPVPVAVKTCKPDADAGTAHKLLHEAANMQQFDHAHIIRLVGVCSATPTYMVMELAAHGELRAYLRDQRTHLQTDTLLLYCYQLSQALSYLESRRFVHRDIAARNVLVHSADCVKLADFGLSRWVENHSYYKASKCKLPIKWMSPESINFRRFSTQSDVWMFAVCVWEIMTLGAVKPFQGVPNGEVAGRIESGERLARPAGCPASVYALMLHCWHYDPGRRPAFSQLKQQLSAVLEDSRRDEDGYSSVQDAGRWRLEQLQLRRRTDRQQRQMAADRLWLSCEEEGRRMSLAGSSDADSTDGARPATSPPPLIVVQRIQVAPTADLERSGDAVYASTTAVVRSVMVLSRGVQAARSEQYLQLVRAVGLQLRGLLGVVDSQLVSFPPHTHREIELAHQVLAADMQELVASMRQAQRYSSTTLDDAYRKQMLQSAHVLAVDAKHLLDTVDAVRIRTASPAAGTSASRSPAAGISPSRSPAAGISPSRSPAAGTSPSESLAASSHMSLIVTSATSSPTATLATPVQ